MFWFQCWIWPDQKRSIRSISLLKILITRTCISESSIQIFLILFYCMNYFTNWPNSHLFGELDWSILLPSLENRIWLLQFLHRSFDLDPTKIEHFQKANWSFHSSHSIQLALSWLSGLVVPFLANWPGLKLKSVAIARFENCELWKSSKTHLKPAFEEEFGLEDFYLPIRLFPYQVCWSQDLEFFSKFNHRLWYSLYRKAYI